MNITYRKYHLDYKFRVLTSRGAIPDKTVYIVKLESEDGVGYGECTTIPKLSIDHTAQYEERLQFYCNLFSDKKIELSQIIEPSIRFGFECAWLDFQNQGQGILFPSKFTKGFMGIPINGLVWMNSLEEMYVQAVEKINQGFKCIKIKVGSHDFELECELLQKIRNLNEEIELRLDANGAFTYDSALDKLNSLSKFNIHSIEQPIAVRRWKEMKDLVAKSPIKIALDEELIGIEELVNKVHLIEQINPHFLVLKPSLIGGFKACEEWIKLCKQHNINFWITSALESNIGLNAIAQWTANYDLDLPHGLGTGEIYQNNFTTGLIRKNEHLYFSPQTIPSFEL